MAGSKYRKTKHRNYRTGIQSLYSSGRKQESSVIMGTAIPRKCFSITLNMMLRDLKAAIGHGGGPGICILTLRVQNDWAMISLGKSQAWHSNTRSVGENFTILDAFR